MCMFETPLGDFALALAWIGAIYGFIVLILWQWNREVINVDNEQAKSKSHKKSRYR